MFIVRLAFFVRDRDRGAQERCVLSSLLCEPGVRRDHDEVRQFPAFDLLGEHRQHVQIVHRNVEEALDLRRVQVHRNHPIGSRHRDRVSADTGAMLTASATPATVERMKRYEIAAFVRDARSVSSDPAVEQRMLNDLLAHADGAANKFLESYFHADDFAKNPFQVAKHQTVSVQIESILEVSPKSYEVRWSETART